MNLTKFAKFINRLEQESIKRGWQVELSTTDTGFIETHVCFDIYEKSKDLTVCVQEDLHICFMNYLGEEIEGSVYLDDPGLYDQIDKLLEQ